VVAGLWFGWRGGVLAALTTSVLYLPGILAFGSLRPAYTPDQYGEALDLFITGSVVGVLANRERRKAVELQRANDRLEQTYRQLHESIEKLRHSERLSAVGQLAANLAHEIRNPLASIEGAADLLKDSGPEAGHEFVQIIKKESRRLSKLLTDLLDFARPRSPEYTFVPLSESMHSVAELVQPMAQKARISLREESAADVQPVQCDPAQIKQVILNLVMNAIQTMPEGGEIVLRERREGNRAILEVADQGSGLTAEEIEQLFIPFYTTKKDGTGLGLSIAQQVVLAHAGEISVHENTPKGSVFRVRLPLVQPNHAETPAN
jgi:signal transduction histidine kinase